MEPSKISFNLHSTFFDKRTVYIIIIKIRKHTTTCMREARKDGKILATLLAPKMKINLIFLQIGAMKIV